MMLSPEYQVVSKGAAEDLSADQCFQTWVNGVEVSGPQELQQGDRIWIGRNFVFYFLDPKRPALSVEPQYHDALVQLLKNEEGFKSPEEIEEEIRRKQAEWQLEVEEQLAKQKEDTQKRLEKQRLEV